MSRILLHAYARFISVGAFGPRSPLLAVITYFGLEFFKRPWTVYRDFVSVLEPLVIQYPTKPQKHLVCQTILLIMEVLLRMVNQVLPVIFNHTKREVRDASVSCD